MKLVLSGNEAAAYGAMLARAEVISAYPITPQTKIVEKIADLIADGRFKTEFIKVESEHSAMAACISASLVGARTFTATSSQGLLLMHEMLHWASGSRTPVVMVNINRAVAPPWSVWADQTDSIAQRDTGWIQYYCESCQEVVDTIMQAYRVCEDPRVLLPAMLSEDAFFLSHTSEIVDLPPQEELDAFLGTYEPDVRLDIDNPRSFGSLSMPHQWYPEFRYKIQEGMEHAVEAIERVDREYGSLFGRSYGGLLDLYRCEDADTVIVAAGSMCSTIRAAIEELRSEGVKVGMARIRVFRPFPTEAFRALAKDVRSLVVLDRSFSMGSEGAFFSEVKAALYPLSDRPDVRGFAVGIGGRDITIETIRSIITDSLRPDTGITAQKWVGLRRCEE
ncbi:MAG: pyruvate ferredoxin oxidoreductase [Candidatus Methanofastidiosa archaeon]|nr:pyruvate ferredoxin oxidoreductase [Candidatus Methanofastidiosa archaeon]